MKANNYIKNITFLCLTIFSVLLSCTEKSKQLTKEEVKDFARKLEISVSKRESAFFDNAIDRKEMMKRAGLSAGKYSKEKINLGTSVVNALSKNGTFELIKQYDKAGIWHLLFRLYENDNMALNYFDFELMPRNDEVKIADGYAYNVGQNLSEVLKDLYHQMDELEANAKEDKDKWLDLIPDMRKLVSQGKFNEALGIFQTIPPDVRKIKLMQIIHVIICSGVDVETQQAALNEYKELYPGEPNIALLEMSGYLLMENYELALPALDELDKMIDKDPLLDFHRSICYKMLGKYDQQKECLARLIHNIPDFENGMLELIAVYLKNKDYEKARPLVKDFRTRSRFNQNSLSLILSSYPGFQE